MTKKEGFYSQTPAIPCTPRMNFYENYIKTSNFDKRFEGRSLQINFDDDFNKDKIIQDMLNKMEISIKEKDIENYYYYLLCLTFCH